MVCRNGPEAARLVVLEGLDDLVPGVHDEGPVGHDRLADGSAPQDQDVEDRVTRLLDLIGRDLEGVPRTVDGQIPGVDGAALGADGPTPGQDGCNEAWTSEIGVWVDPGPR